MKMFVVACTLLSFVTAFGQPQTTAFAFNKGINISAWLSQTDLTEGPERDAYFTEKDVQQLAALGFDHIRLPVDEQQLFSKDGKKKMDGFRLVHQVIGWCQKANMRIIFDCHDLYVSREIKPTAKKPVSIWESDSAQKGFIALWLQFSAELHQYPTDLLAYEILNEPNAPDPAMWNTLSSAAIVAIRKVEPLRVIFLGSNKFNSVTTFDQLKVPANDPNIILSFHFYHPGILTHYNVSSFEGSQGGGGIKLSYPGVLIAKEEMDGLSEEQKAKVKIQQGTFNPEKLKEKMLPPLELAKKLGLRVHCGEFGTNFKYPDMNLLVRWITDITNVLREEKIPYTVWGYRKNFGVFDDHRQVKNNLYLNAILK